MSCIGVVLLLQDRLYSAGRRRQRCHTGPASMSDRWYVQQLRSAFHILPARRYPGQNAQPRRASPLQPYCRLPQVPLASASCPLALGMICNKHRMCSICFSLTCGCGAPSSCRSGTHQDDATTQILIRSKAYTDTLLCSHHSIFRKLARDKTCRGRSNSTFWSGLTKDYSLPHTTWFMCQRSFSRSTAPYPCLPIRSYGSGATP